METRLLASTVSSIPSWKMWGLPRTVHIFIILTWQRWVRVKIRELLSSNLDSTSSSFSQAAQQYNWIGYYIWKFVERFLRWFDLLLVPCPAPYLDSKNCFRDLWCGMQKRFKELVTWTLKDLSIEQGRSHQVHLYDVSYRLGGHASTQKHVCESRAIYGVEARFTAPNAPNDSREP